MANINISASTVKTLDDCSLKIFYNKILKLPEIAHWKTRVGSTTHDILELLALPKHSKFIKQAEKLPFSAIPALNRLLIRKIKQYDLGEHDVVYRDVEEMVKKALDYNFTPKNCIIHPPEFEFNIKIGKYPVRGFLDRVYEYENHINIIDFKSQAKPFSKDELENNLQASLYQYAIRKLFNKKSYVEFIMLRQKTTSKNFIQEVPPLGDEKLDGLEEYLLTVGEHLSKFNFTEAKKNPATRNGKGWQCNFCSFKQEMNYFGLYSEEGKLFRTAFNEKDLKPKVNEMVLPLFHSGCYAYKNSL